MTDTRPETVGTPRPQRGRNRLGWVVLIVAVAVVLLTLPLLWAPSNSSPQPAPPTYPTLPATLGGFNGTPIALDEGFLGVNMRADATLTPGTLGALNSTGVGLVRWPGGGDGDRFDPLADGGRGVVYDDSGIGTPANTTLTQFVQWCKSVSCRSIVTLPAEIDNATIAEEIVNYTERSLGFYPTYWEIGNEPALWTHFGVPWTDWNDSQNLTPTLSQYEQVLAKYIQAIRNVDSSTGILGLGGIGGSAVPQSTWIGSTVSAEGENISGIAIHVYPAGPGFLPTDLSGWFGTLWGRAALPYRVESATATIEKSCVACHVALFVDEFQTGTLLTKETSLSGGYLAAYIGAEIVQTLPLPLASLDYYNLQSGTPGAWLDTAGVASSPLLLYQALRADLGTSAVQVNVSIATRGLLAAAGGTSAADLDDLLLVNANVTDGFRVNLSAQYPQASHASAWVFDGSASTPEMTSVIGSAAQNWTIPPTSLVIFSGLGVPATAELGHPHGLTENRLAMEETTGRLAVRVVEVPREPAMTGAGGGARVRAESIASASQ